MAGHAPLKVCFVLGEESGDALAADLHDALIVRASKQGREVEFHGLAGSRLRERGMNSLFDIEDIAVMGFSAVIARLPKIIRRVYQTVADVVARDPDVLILVDSPDFTHAVAKRVRRKLLDLPIIDYVCPSVWAWRPKRAERMRAYVDHVLTILPFEPEALARLNGPPATYVGHPMSRSIAKLRQEPSPVASDPPILLILPGSRGGEIKRHLHIYGQMLEVLEKRGVEFQAVLPAVPRLKARIAEAVSGWSVKPTLVDSGENDRYFRTARAAMATSGTVTLQLALHRVPTTIAYKFDPVAKMLRFLIDVWSGALPNLIADRVVVQEDYSETVIPERLARRIEAIWEDTPERQRQLDGFDEIISAMETDRAPGELAAEVVLNHVKERPQ